MGVLALYMLGERWQNNSPAAKPEKEKLAKIARHSLERAYHLSHDPVVGFTLEAAYGKVGGDNTAASRALYVDMLRRLGGEKAFHVYLAAKKNGWKGEQPPIPQLSRRNLLILRRIVGDIDSYNSGRSDVLETRLVNGRIVTIDHGFPPYTESQKRAMAYLNEWRQRLKAAAEHSPTA